MRGFIKCFYSGHVYFNINVIDFKVSKIGNIQNEIISFF